jgi:hypothetical protein
MPRVSIVIPVHNRADLLPETLESVLSQETSDWECIIVDDHSIDESGSVARRIARQDGRFRAIVLPHNKRGGNAARNFGLSLAQGAFVNFLDSDDLIVSRKLTVQLAAFDKNPECDMVTCRHAVFKSDPVMDALQVRFSAREFWLDVLWRPTGLTGTTWQTNSPLWRTPAIRAIGGWDESITAWQDPELNVRAILGGLTIKWLDEILVFVRRSSAHAYMCADPPEVRYPQARHAIITAWRHLAAAGQATRSRGDRCAFRLYEQNLQCWSRGQKIRRLGEWIHDSRMTGHKLRWTVLGAVALLAGHLRVRGYWRLKNALFRELCVLKCALPDLADIPMLGRGKGTDERSDRDQFGALPEHGRRGNAAGNR